LAVPQIKNDVYSPAGLHKVIVFSKKIMKTFQILVIGAFGLISSFAVSSCASRGTCEKCAPAAAGAGAPAASAASAAVPVPLTAFFNTPGIVADGATFSGGVDRDGFACSSNLLGTAQSWSGVRFQLGSANKDANVVTCNGQAIPLPAGKFSKLEMLAIAVNGAQASQNFTITYADTNLNQTFSQSLSDWNSPDSNSGESQAVSMDYRDQSDGTKDETEYYLYGYSFSLNAAGTALSLVLPDNNNVKIFAITLVP
jgi:hypothetical protein